ncbi:MAG: hypothetical protein H0U45_03990 [Tatlockia sp.]|nr:hypothetical protein [Tatlockia sp.]
MTDSINISKVLQKSEVNQEHGQLYLLLGLLANLSIWGIAFLYLKFVPPTYVSESAISLPSLTSTGKVNLPGIGEASYQDSSPYDSTTRDPRENYKFLGLSEPVLKAAAAKINIPLGEFDKPQIKILDNTTIIEIRLKGSTPEEARNKSLVFYQAFEEKLGELRIQEAITRDVGVKTALNSSQRKLEIAQERLSNYRAESGLTSDEQIKELTSNVEQLRKQRAELMAQQQQADGRSRELSSNLKTSSSQATEAFALQSDQQFQQNLKNYSEASVNLEVLGTKFLSSHPTMVAERAKRDAARNALLARSQSILGRPINLANLQQFNLGSGGYASAKENLSQQVITAQVDQQGLTVQIQELDRQILLFENRLEKMAKQDATLSDLKRNTQVAEAIFSANLTKLDINKSNTVGSYPLVQVISEPSLSEKPITPNKPLALAGAILGSLLSTTGIVLYWLRDRHKNQTKQIKRSTHETV